MSGWFEVDDGPFGNEVFLSEDFSNAPPLYTEKPTNEELSKELECWIEMMGSSNSTLRTSILSKTIFSWVGDREKKEDQDITFWTLDDQIREEWVEKMCSNMQVDGSKHGWTVSEQGRFCDIELNQRFIHIEFYSRNFSSTPELFVNNEYMVVAVQKESFPM